MIAQGQRRGVGLYLDRCRDEIASKVTEVLKDEVRAWLSGARRWEVKFLDSMGMATFEVTRPRGGVEYVVWSNMFNRKTGGLGGCMGRPDAALRDLMDLLSWYDGIAGDARICCDEFELRGKEARR